MVQPLNIEQWLPSCPKAAHDLDAVVILFLASIGWFIPAAFLIGLVREVTEEGSPVTLAKCWRAIRNSPGDLAGWSFGGLVLTILNP